MSEPRAELAKALSTYLTPAQVTKLIDEILAIDKRASAEFRCKKCEQRQMAWTTIPDAKAVTSALTDLMSQAFGRPQEASSNTDPILFYRLTNMEEANALQLVGKEWGGQSQQRRENGEVHPETPEGTGLQQTESPADLQSVDTEDEPPIEETLRRCRACGELKPTIMFLPKRRGAQICHDCRT